MAPTTSTGKSDDTSSTLSSVVSNLVRASMGTSLAPTVTDEDLDRHVAELILREAKKKAEKYGQQGIRAYIASNLQDSNAPRTNKRFLSSIIRSTDDHNKAILRAQAEAAEEIKRVRREEERKERRARAEEAVRARKEKHRNLHSSSSRSHSYSQREQGEGEGEESWDRWDGRTANRDKERGKRKVRSWETWQGDDSSEDAEERIRRERNRDKDQERKRSRSREEKRRSRRGGRDDDNERNKDGDRRRKRRKDRDNDDESKRRKDKTTSPRHGERSRHRHRRHHRSRSHSKDHSRRNRSGSRSPGRTPDNKKERKYTSADLREGESRQASMDERDTEPQRLKSSVMAKEALSIAGALSSHTPTSYDRRQSSSRGRGQSPSRSHCTGSPSPIRQQLQKPSHSKSSSRNSSHTRSMSLSRSRPSSPSPGPSPPLSNLPSKMDKYFDEHYDPRLDVTPLSTAPNVPATGLINDADFEGWDAMLELIKLRKQDKEDRKRLEQLGLVDKKGKGKDKLKSSLVSASVGASGSSILDIEYKKRGTIREWDLGKEGVDLSF